MKLNDSIKRDYLSTASGDEKTTKMSISADVESHIVRVLTEHTYSDPLGSAIRECVSNAVDSVTEAGTNLPVVVRIQNNKSNLWELSVEDKGLGLDDASFKRYIMGIGESTKRNSNVLLGGYGAGAKAWLAYTDTFVYTCRKDGVERKYVIFKGEEFPESTLIKQTKTTEVNGVTVTVILKNNYNEINTVVNKIKEQLAYLDNVWYDIPDFNNTVTIYRQEHFQYTEMHNSSIMHITLKNIYYRIDWEKLGIPRIEIPIALKFDDYEEIKPVFNREQINWNSNTAKAIMTKLSKVADWFSTTWNRDYNKEDLHFKNLYAIIREKRLVNLPGGFLEVNATELKNYVTVPFDEYAFGQPLQKFGVNKLISEGYHVCSELFTVAVRAEYTSYSRSKWNSCWSVVSSASTYSSTKLILVNFDLKGHTKAYLLKKYKGNFMVLKDNEFDGQLSSNLGRVMGVNNMSLFQLQELKTAILYFKDKLLENFVDETGLLSDKDYLEYVKEYKEKVKEEQKSKGNTRYIALDKQAGEITTYVGRISLVSKSVVAYDKTKMKIEDLSKMRKLVVYSCEKFPESWILASELFPKVAFIRFNVSEVKHVKNLPNFMTKQQFMNSKPLSRLATAFLVNDILNATPPKIEVISYFFKKTESIRIRMEQYKNKNLTHNVTEDVRKLIMQDVSERNAWDMSIYQEAKDYEKEMRNFGFLKVISNCLNRYWTLTSADKQVIQNMAYILAKHNKVNSNFLEGLVLIKKEEMEQEKLNDQILQNHKEFKEEFSE